MKSKNCRQTTGRALSRPSLETDPSETSGRVSHFAAKAILAALFATAACTSAIAADVYRWVDERGVTNMSDVVPDQYKKVAQKVDIAPDTPEQARKDSVARTTASASSAPSSAPTRRPVAGPAGITSARAASAGALSSADDGEDCATLQRRYKESQDCFGPQPRTITGAINGARAPQCPVVVDPSPKCGLPNNGEGPPAPGP